MKRSAIFSAVVAALGLTVSANAAVVFDSMTKYLNVAPNIVLGVTTSAPNTFMGTGVTLASGTTSLTGLDMFPVNNTTATTFNALRLNIFIWDNVNLGTVNATTPAFSSLLGSYSVTSTGTFSPGFFYSFTDGTSATNPGAAPGISFATPLALADTTIGITFNIQGSTNGGLTYANVQNLTSPIMYGTAGSGANPVSVGSALFNGYYRNAATEVNGNFVSALRSLGQDNQTLGFRLYDGTVVPEPTMVGLLAPLALVAGRRRRA